MRIFCINYIVIGAKFVELVKFLIDVPVRKATSKSPADTCGRYPAELKKLN